MNKTGVVIRKDMNKAVIQIERTGECGDKCASCSASCKVPNMEVEVENTLDAEIGDYVNISIGKKTLITSSFILYTIPLISFILGVIIGYNISVYYKLADGELVSIGLGFLTLILSYFIISKLTSHKKEIIKMESKLKRFDN